MYYTFLVLRIFIQFNVFVDGTKETEPKQEFMSFSKYYSKYLTMDIPYIFTQYYIDVLYIFAFLNFLQSHEHPQCTDETFVKRLRFYRPYKLW